MSEAISDLNAATLARVYIQMRTAIQELEEKIKEIEAQKELVSERILALCNEEDANTISTPDGTISRRVQQHFWTSDWDSFYSFVRQHDVMHLLEKRIHNGNMKEFLTKNPEEVPPGLQANQKCVITVRKPTGNKETL